MPLSVLLMELVSGRLFSRVEFFRLGFGVFIGVQGCVFFYF